MAQWLYLAGLKAAAEMARAMGEADAAQRYEQMLENGRAWVEEHLFNGSYYEQQVDLKTGRAWRNSARTR